MNLSFKMWDNRHDIYVVFDLRSSYIVSIMKEIIEKMGVLVWRKAYLFWTVS